MIDLSQSAGRRRDLLRATLYEAVREPYRDYPILGVDPRTVVLRSNTPEGFLFDLGTMIHNTDKECWEVNKVDKRLARYVAFLFAHVLSPDVAGTRERKLRGLRALADRLASLETLLASPPLRTGVRPVDEFAARERADLVSGAKSKMVQYLDAMRKVVTSLLACVSQTPAWNSSLVFESSIWHTDHLKRHTL